MRAGKVRGVVSLMQILRASGLTDNEVVFKTIKVLSSFGDKEGAKQQLKVLLSSGNATTAHCNWALKELSTGENFDFGLLSAMDKNNIHMNEQTFELVKANRSLSEATELRQLVSAYSESTSELNVTNRGHLDTRKPAAIAYDHDVRKHGLPTSELERDWMRRSIARDLKQEIPSEDEEVSKENEIPLGLNRADWLKAVGSYDKTTLPDLTAEERRAKKISDYAAYQNNNNNSNKKTSTDLRALFLEDGAVWPLDVLQPQEAATLRETLALEMSGIDSSNSNTDFATNDLLYYKSHFIFTAVNKLARHPTIMNFAKKALGTEDLLLWDSSIPLKPPSSSNTPAGIFPWHQDMTYWGLEPIDGAVSCWVALGDASEEHGCMKIIRGSHKNGQHDHSLLPEEEGSMLRRGQQVIGVDEKAAEPMALNAGQMSMHHPGVLHCSSANTMLEERVGVVLVYVSPSTVPNNQIGSATLVDGQCEQDCWTLSDWQPVDGVGVGASKDERALDAHAKALGVHRGELQATL